MALEDDQDLQPADNFVPAIRTEATNDEIAAVLDAVSAELTVEDMQALVASVSIDGENPEDAAGAWLEEKGLPGDLTAEGEITVGSANFAESSVTGQLYGQALEAAGVTVDYTADIGSREVYWEALKAGEIDLIAEFTGTLLAFLDPEATPSPDVEEVLAELRPLTEEVGVTILEPAEADSVNTFVVTSETAEEYDLATVSDLAVGARQPRAGRAAGVPRASQLPDRADRDLRADVRGVMSLGWARPGCDDRSVSERPTPSRAPGGDERPPTRAARGRRGRGRPRPLRRPGALPGRRPAPGRPAPGPARPVPGLVRRVGRPPRPVRPGRGRAGHGHARRPPVGAVRARPPGRPRLLLLHRHHQPQGRRAGGQPAGGPCFGWIALSRQVRVEGPVERLSDGRGRRLLGVPAPGQPHLGRRVGPDPPDRRPGRAGGPPRRGRGRGRPTGPSSAPRAGAATACCPRWSRCGRAGPTASTTASPTPATTPAWQVQRLMP